MENFDLINGKMYKKCPHNKIRNPKTLRCINNNKKIAVAVITNKDTKECQFGKIYNPLTKRCISIKSKIGRNLLGLAQRSNNTSNEQPIIVQNREKVLDLIRKLKTELTNKTKTPALNVKKYAPILSPIIEASTSVKSSSPPVKSASTPVSSSSTPVRSSSTPVKSLSTSISSVKSVESLLGDTILSPTIDNRIQYYNNLVKILQINSIDKNYCMRFLKYDKFKNPIYTIKDNILLKNKIGDDNIDSIIYHSQVVDKVNNKTIHYMSKLVLHNPAFIQELAYLSLLSNAVIRNRCPHFPILYADLECHKFTSTPPPVNDISLYPRIIKLNPNKSFHLLLTELANGTLKSFMQDKTINSSSLYMNAFVQIILSILFFYNEAKAFYNNINTTSFIYHKIDSSKTNIEYFQYTIFDFHFYVPNQGFLWVLWNFKKPIPFTDARLTHYRINNDFHEISKLFNNTTILKSLYKVDADIIVQFNELVKYSSNIYTPQAIIAFIKKICNFLKKNNLISTSIDPTKSTVINPSPYLMHLSHFR